MSPPSGADSLELRQAYLRRRRAGRGRAPRLIWVILTVLVLWLLIAALVGIAR